MRPLGLTRRMLDVLTFVQAYTRTNGMSPTYQEIADGVGLSSKSGVNRIINELAERGHVTRIHRRERSITIISTQSFAPTTTLPPNTALALAQYCDRHNEKPEDIINDAVLLFIDERGDVTEASPEELRS